MEEKKMITIMNKRGFKLEKKIYDEQSKDFTYIFIKEKDVEVYAEYVILVEVLPTQTWHLFYRQSGMVGFMDSGEFGKLEDEFMFTKIYNLFNKQVNCLRDGLR